MCEAKTTPACRGCFFHCADPPSISDTLKLPFKNPLKRKKSMPQIRKTDARMKNAFTEMQNFFLSGHTEIQQINPIRCIANNYPSLSLFDFYY
jgi:hypothetical protein